jgi:pyrroloquinoline quinone biosynthesis protein B
VHIRVLGSAAGGGFPQWNCACFNCRGVREGRIAASARTQESVAVGVDKNAWFLINASPEIRQHIEGFVGLQPSSPRHTPIQGILLTNGDLDHCLGLLSLRESQPLVVYATESVWLGFTRGNVLYRTLTRFAGQVTWVPIALDVSQPLKLMSGEASGLSVVAVPLPGKLPIHLEGQTPSLGDNIGLRITADATGKVLAYLPAVGERSPVVERAAHAADAVFFDGTFWSNTELIEQGLGDKRAQDMAHWPIGGSNGSLAWLRNLSVKHRVFIHVNNTNPVLRDDSPERQTVRDAGLVVAHDGMELSL